MTFSGYQPVIPAVFSILITERGGAQRQLDLDAAEVSVGRLEDNDVVLPRSNVSKRHAQILLKDDRYVLVDLRSTNGTYLNGRRITAPMSVVFGDKIYIGDFILALQDTPRRHVVPRKRDPQPTHPGTGAVHAEPADSGEPSVASMAATTPPTGPATDAPPDPVRTRRGTPLPRPHLTANSAHPPPPPPPPSSPPLQPSSIPPGSTAASAHSAALRAHDEADTAERIKRVNGPAPRVPSVPPRLQDPESGHGPATSPAVLAPSVRLQGALQTLMERLATRMDVTESKERAFPSEHQGTLDGLIDELAREGVIGPDLDRRFLTQAAQSEAVGLGPLDRLFASRATREVVVDGPSRILADMGGGLSPVSSFFSSAQAVQVTLRRLCARAGTELGKGPVQELELPDGTQVQVLLPPLSASGPLISIRCPLRQATSADSLVTEGVLSMDMLNLLRSAVQRRLNVLVVGPATSGVSSLLAALAAMCLDHERIVTLQRSPSLAIQHPHVLPLNLAGARENALAELWPRAARLRADRLVIDDVQGSDALPLLLGAATARGVLAGVHAATPFAALEQLELFAQIGLASARPSLAQLLAHAFQLVVHVSVDNGGARRVQTIAEIRLQPGEPLELIPLYRYDNGWKITEFTAGFL